MTDDKVAVGLRIRAAREQRKMKVAELADKVGARWHTVDRYEKGEIRPSAARLVQIAQALGVTPAWLQTGAEAGEQVERDVPETVRQAIEDHEHEVMPEAVKQLRGIRWHEGIPTYRAVVVLLKELDAQLKGKAEDRPRLEPPPRRPGRKER